MRPMDRVIWTISYGSYDMSHIQSLNKLTIYLVVIAKGFLVCVIMYEPKHTLVFSLSNHVINRG